jgi:hypothetical protein
MTEALKTDRLEQAKREIDEELDRLNQMEPNLILRRHMTDDPRRLKGKLYAERARNMELREVIRIEREFSANLKRKTYDAVQTIQSIFED